MQVAIPTFAYKINNFKTYDLYLQFSNTYICVCVYIYKNYIYTINSPKI